jgi:hypothetical protein
MKITWSYKVVKCFSIENVNGLNVVFTILHKKNGFKNLIKNDDLMSNKDSKSMFIKLCLYFKIMIQLPINCILMGIFRKFQSEWNFTYSFLYYM